MGGFLAGYSGNTRLACQQDLRHYAVWCHRQQIPLFDVRRTHIELFARWLEHRSRPSHDFPATLDGGGFYRYCAEEQLPTSNPAVNVRRPRSRDETTIRVLDRSELGAFLVQAGLRRRPGSCPGMSPRLERAPRLGSPRRRHRRFRWCSVTTQACSTRIVRTG